MSLLNVSLNLEGALVAVDTEMVAPVDGTRAHGSKLLALPHLHAVFGFRGAQTTFTALFMMLHASVWDDLDELLGYLPSILPSAVEAAKAMVKTDPRFAPPDPAMLGELQLALVAWSPREERMIGHVFTQLVDGQGFQAERIRDYLIAPSDPSIENLPDPDTPATMERLARAQVALIKATDPGKAGGGRLLLCEITRRDITITQHCDLDAAAERPSLPLTRKIGPVRVSTEVAG